MRKKSKAIKFTGPRQCLVEEVEVDPDGLTAGQFLLETEFSIVSVGTELANYAAWDPGVFQAGSWNEYPSSPGYGAVGHVVAVGSAPASPEGMPAVGERVFAFTKHASLAVGDVNRLFAVPIEEADDGTVMVLTRIAGVAMTVVRRALSLQVGGAAVVVGLGLVGNFAAQLLQLAGLNVTGIEPDEYRASIGRRVGLEAVVQQRLDGQLLADHPELAASADVVVEATGLAPLALAATPLARSGGQVLLLGTPRIPHDADATELLRDVQLRGLTITGASEWSLSTKGVHGLHPESWSIAEGYTAIRRLLLHGKLKGKELISEVVSPDKAPSIYEDLLGAKRSLLGVVFNWEGRK